MACSLKSVFCVPELNESMLGSKSKGVFRLCPSTHGKARSSSTYSGHPYSVLSTDFMGKPIVLPEEKGSGYCSSKTSRDGSIHVHYEALLLSGFSTFRFPIMFSLFSPLLTFNLIFFFWFQAQATICVSKALRWWKKNLKPNMVEIHSAQELVHSLLNAGDALVVVDFYSPGCGGCKALHPKV